MRTNELLRLALEEHMIPGAQVEASRSITMEAPIEKVWGILTDVPRWASWYPYLSNAKLSGVFAADTKLSYGGFIKHDLAIAKVRRGERVMIYGKLMGYSAVTKWEFKNLSDSRTKVTFTESSVGFLIAVFYSTQKLGEHLGRWLERLKAEAERQ